jgi:hypothetical protein
MTLLGRTRSEELHLLPQVLGRRVRVCCRGLAEGLSAGVARGEAGPVPLGKSSLLDRPHQPIGGGLCPRYYSIMVDYQSVPTASRIFRLSLRPRGVQTSFSIGLSRTETSNVHRFTLISATQISACEGS